MRDAYVSTLYDIAKKNKHVMSINADIGAIIFNRFIADFPDRFINAGVAEQNMMGVAAGLASCGKIPFVYTMVPFITARTYEQIKIDVCLQRNNVKIVGVGAGISYSTLGPTHHGIDDIAIMKTLPNMNIVSPADPLETKLATYSIAEMDKPVYLRLGTSGELNIHGEDYSFEFGKGEVLKDGNDVTLIATGSILFDVLMAAKVLENEYCVECRVINIHTIKPLDKDIIIKAARETNNVIVIEEHSIEGGLGESIASVILESNYQTRFIRMGINDSFCMGYGTHQELKSIYGLTKEGIITRVLEIM